MGIRFRKRIKIAPGVTVNVGKSSVGVRVGVKGAGVSANTKGKTTSSVGLPGTGLSYQKHGTLKSKNTEPDNSVDNESTPYGGGCLIAVVVFVVLFLVFLIVFL